MGHYLCECGASADFESLYGGLDSLNTLSESKNIQDWNGHNRKLKLILKSYCVRPIDLTYTNSWQFVSRPASQITRKRSRDESRRRIYARKIPHAYTL